ncbi:serine hydrolase, partial [Actinomadura kijaniata]|uniref:serine hydrolase n=1 Tax=Actinomadura kijaniata TaxID=46161 RepID=UPI003F1A13DF
MAAVVAALGAATVVCSLPAQARGRGDVVQQGMDNLVDRDGYPAVLSSVRDRGGRVHDYTAGVADLKSRAKVPADGRVRAGSNTKPFTAVLVLQ